MFLNNQTPSPNEGSEKKIEKEAGKRQDNKKKRKEEKDKRRKGQEQERTQILNLQTIENLIKVVQSDLCGISD